GGWQGFGPPRLHVHAGFGERTRFLFGARWGSTPRPDPKHKLKLLEVEPSGRPEALSPKVPMMKSKADANAATIVPKKVQKLAEDWSCAPPYQVSAPSESGLNEHLGGREHKAKLAQCGVSKATKGNKSCLQTTTGNVNNTDPCDAPKKICMLVDSATCEAGLNEDLGGRKHEAKLVQCGVSKAIKDDKNCLQMTTGNENNTDPCDAPKEICMLVDGEMHEVVWKNNYLWCDRCRVRCDSKVIMAGHLRSKNHSKLNKVWTSIKAVRTNTDTKEGLPSCGSQALSSNPKVPTMKRKTDANAATTVPKKVQKLAKDWSCALCQVSAPCEAALNEHLGGRKHKAKLAQCGVSKAIKDDKNCLQTPTGNENSTDPCDAPRKICMLVDGATCEAGLNEHLGGSKHKAKLAQCGVSKAIKDDKNCLQTPTGNENSTDPCDAPRKICMLVDGATCEAGLNDHLGGRKHKAKLAQCGVSKTIKDDKNCLQTTTGNENSTDPCDAPKKMCMLVDGAPSEGGLNEHLGGRKHKAKLAQCGVSKAIKDDKNCLQATTGNENSTDPCDAPKKICMLVDGATCEAGLTEHLGGRNIKAKLAQCGASKAIKDDKNSLHTTTGNKNSTDPCDAPKKIFLLIDGEMHEVVQKNKHLWCDRCRVRCYSNATMAGHLRSKKHSKLNKVWTSIKAVRTNTDTKEGLPSCGSQVNTNGSTEIPAVIEGDINMTTKVDESGPVENPVQKEIHLRSKKHSKLNNVWTSIKAVRTNTETKEGLPSCGSQVNTNGSTESPAVIEGGINTTTEVDESGPVENPVQKEIHLRSKKYSKLDKVWTSIKAVRTNTDSKEGLLSCGSQVNTNGPTEILAVIEGNINMTAEVDESGPVENPVLKEITRMATIWAMFSS
uniref:U1-type domain-containing protein n=1 Tax=Aegilops tauschii subsp. strangulata TaxID=200361 RepID=A0A453T4L1_AEGTS